MKSVLVIGNSVDEQDSLALRIVEEITPDFSQIEFLPWDPTEELPANVGKDIVLIDVIQGIESVTVFYNLDDFLISPRNTVHDFDLPVALKMLQKIGKVGKVTIIGLPFGGDQKKVLNQLKNGIASLRSQ